jgi:hypothetical protein
MLNQLRAMLAEQLLRLAFQLIPDAHYSKELLARHLREYCSDVQRIERRAAEAQKPRG